MINCPLTSPCPLCKKCVTHSLEDEPCTYGMYTDPSNNIMYGKLIDPRNEIAYRTVKIGTQIWMAENFNFNSNDSVCYKHESDMRAIYGRLYTWDAAILACPNGWHLPSYNDWRTLVDFVGGDNVAGKKLKAKTGWAVDGNGTDDYGFSALPGGYGYSDGDFHNVGNYGHWWTSSEHYSDDAHFWGMSYCGKHIFSDTYDKKHFFSVRYVMNSVRVK